jgi:hypothetical protein
MAHLPTEMRETYQREGYYGSNPRQGRRGRLLRACRCCHQKPKSLLMLGGPGWSKQTQLEEDCSYGW